MILEPICSVIFYKDKDLYYYLQEFLFFLVVRMLEARSKRYVFVPLNIEIVVDITILLLLTSYSLTSLLLSRNEPYRSCGNQTIYSKVHYRWEREVLLLHH